MNLVLEFNDLSVIINVVIRIATTLIFLSFLIPLLIKETKVKNGLILLRVQLLVANAIIFFINGAGLIIIPLRHFGVDIQLLADTVIYINSLGFLGYVLIQLKIYTQRFTPENKALHAKFEEIENKAINAAEKRKNKK